MSGKSLLLIDDDKSNLHLMDQVLSELDCQVETASSAEDALVLMKHKIPDVIISDIKMPGMDGLEFTRKVKNDPRTKSVPIILITGMDEQGTKLKGIKAGCDDFISKPYDIYELQARVKSLLKLSNYSQQMVEKTQLDFIIDHITNGLVICDQDFFITRLNEKAQELIGISDLKNDNLLDVLYNTYECLISRREFINHTLKHKNIEFFRGETSQAGPLYLVCEVNYVDSSRSGDNIILILKDITNERVTQRLKQDFISLISHKLKSPLVVISGMSKNLKDELKVEINEKHLEMFDELKTNVLKLESLVEKLINFSMISNNNLMARQDRNYHPFEILREAVKRKIYFYSHKSVNITYQSDLPDNFSYGVLTREQFVFIVDNLVENAIKFNQNKMVIIEFDMWLEEEFFMVEISDNGIGIPPEEYQKIFESFYQYEKIFTGNVEGMGIGLAMVKRILEELGGRITVKSELGIGSSFRVIMPVQSKRL